MIEEELLVTIAFAFYLANLIAVSFYLYRFQNTLADLVHNAREHRDTFDEQNIDDHRASEIQTTAEAVANLVIAHVTAHGAD